MIFIAGVQVMNFYHQHGAYISYGMLYINGINLYLTNFISSKLFFIEHLNLAKRPSN